MHKWYPLLVIGGVLGILSIIFIIAYATMKDKKEAIGFDRKMSDGELIRRLLHYARPFKKSFLLAGFFMLLAIAYSISAPLIVAAIEKTVRGKFELSTLYTYVGVYVSMLIVSSIASYAQAIILQRAGQRIVSAIREDLFCHIESLSHGQLNTIPVGKLVTRLTNDTNAISMMFTNLLVNLIKNFLMIIGVMVAMLMLNFELTLMVLSFVPFILLFTIVFRKFSRKAYRRVKDSTTDINTFLSENLSGMKIIQIFGKEQSKMNDFSIRNRKLKNAAMQQLYVFGIFRPIVHMLYIASVLCLFYLGAKGYLDGTTFLGQTIAESTIVAFYMYIEKFYNPIQSLAEQFNWLQSAFASAEKIFVIMDIQPEVQDEEDAIELEHVNGDIEFSHVSFAYVPGEWVLKDVSFSVKAGQTVAFVGATGSGKSTILSLLCRNYDIAEGKITLDGIDIRHIKKSSLRSHFGQMLQDVFLFSGTIRSNIVLRDESFDDDQIMEACRYVNADKLIDKLPNGLDEEVRERGNNFSAGQRQLISFARTVIRRPEIMILDEATANIDTETEQLIQDSLERMMNIGTMLIVAHRLSTIQHADKIIVLSSGRIIEQGTHEELLAMRGRYYQLYNLQFLKNQLES